MKAYFSWPSILWALGLAVLMGTTAPQPGDAGQDGLRIYAADGSVEDVLFDLKDAIINRGLKIDNSGYVGAMMARTNKDFGDPKPIYKDAQYLTFCSVKLTRAMVYSGPWNVGFCPYVVFLYELHAEPGKTYVGYRRPPASGSDEEKKAIGAIDKLLDDIVRETTE